jgi:predicted nicotinamide N-methyase
MKKIFREAPYTTQLPSDGVMAKLAPMQPVPGCGSIVAHQSEDLYSLWEAWEAESGRECPTPFWAIAWPATMVLARHLLKNADLVKNKRVLDIGCGGGVACIAAALGGASRVIANDIDPAALIIADRNFAANNVTVETCNRNLTNETNDIEADLLLVSDLFYHRSSSEALLTYLHRAQKRGSIVLIADSNRPFTPSTGVTLIAQETVPVSMELEGVAHREVKLLALGEQAIGNRL